MNKVYLSLVSFLSSFSEGREGSQHTLENTNASDSPSVKSKSPSCSQNMPVFCTRLGKDLGLVSHPGLLWGKDTQALKTFGL